MKFEDFVEMYFDDISPKLKLNTLMTKKTVISKKITPYFKGKPMNEIKACDIVKWQNEMMEFVNEKGKPYSKKSLQGMQSQLSAIFNHAVRLYELDKNPVRIAGPIGGESEVKEMQIWTTEEYKKFSEAISDKPQAFYAFEVLYWTGIRLGELLALTVSDFDFKKQTMRIDKSLQNIKGKVYVTTPKTVMSNRTVKIPEFLCHGAGYACHRWHPEEGGSVRWLIWQSPPAFGHGRKSAGLLNMWFTVHCAIQATTNTHIKSSRH